MNKRIKTLELNGREMSIPILSRVFSSEDGGNFCLFEWFFCNEKFISCIYIFNPIQDKGFGFEIRTFSKNEIAKSSNSHKLRLFNRVINEE